MALVPRTLCASLAAVCCLGVGAAGHAATPVAAASCRAPEGATAVYRNGTVVVYRRARAQTSASYWGCLRSTGRRTVLPGASSSRALSSFRGAGRYLGFVIENVDARSMTGRVGVRVFDLRAGRALSGVSLDVSPLPSAPDRLRFSRLVLTATGIAAWRESGRTDRIAARDAHGRRRVLATGPPGSLTSLTLARGITAQWRDAGQVRRRRIDRLGR